MCHILSEWLRIGTPVPRRQDRHYSTPDRLFFKLRRRIIAYTHAWDGGIPMGYSPSPARAGMPISALGGCERAAPDAKHRNGYAEVCGAR